MDSNMKMPKNIKAILEIAAKLKIDGKQKLQPPKIAWELKNLRSPGQAILGTLGNFSLITGKAKSGKSFFMNIALSTAVSGNLIFERFKSKLPKEQNEVLYFDTEQGKYHVQLALKNICRQIKIDEPSNLHVYHLRSKKPKERLKIIEALIYENKKVGFIVIDGIKDLVTSVNDEDQASDIASKLLKWSEECNIHIIGVLHQNPSNPKARGHLGTELVNKAETVLSVIKDNDTFIVGCTESRNKPTETFAFEIIDGLPTIIKDYEEKTTSKKSKSPTLHTDNFKVQKLISDTFSADDSFTYSKLVIQMKLSYKKLFNTNLGDNAAKKLIKHCKDSGFLYQAVIKGPYTNEHPKF